MVPLFYLFYFTATSYAIFFFAFAQLLTWTFGVLLLFVSIGVSFLGYVLPWGQMSFWGATVITNLISSVPYVGALLVQWVWGGFSVDGPTLSRFFSIHFIMPFILMVLIACHLLSLHQKGSRNPLGVGLTSAKISFFPFFTYKDLVAFFVCLFISFFLVFYFPLLFIESDNFIAANSMVTPVHIQPEWYFLFAYTILRRVPSKLGGVVLMVTAIAILFVFPFFFGQHQGMLSWRKRGHFFCVLFNLIFLTWAGMKVASYPYRMLGGIGSVYYFLGWALYLKNNLFFLKTLHT